MGAAFEQINGRVVHDEVVPARGSWSREIKQGQTLRMIDLEGTQAVDFLCYNARDYEDRYAAADTMKINGNLFIRKGATIYSIHCNPMFTVTADTVGRHDTIAGCCSPGINRLRYGKPDDHSCRANFLHELRKWGMGPRDVVANLNFFMILPVGRGGEMEIIPAVSKPGDYVDLKAEMDVVAVISNCPQVNNPCNAYKPTPIRVIVSG